MPVSTEVAVLEMGAGKPGDIAYLAGIARPDIALVNNVAPAHLERMLQPRRRRRDQGRDLRGAARRTASRSSTRTARTRERFVAMSGDAPHRALLARARRRRHRAHPHARRLDAHRARRRRRRIVRRRPAAARPPQRAQRARGRGARARAPARRSTRSARGSSRCRASRGRLTRHALANGVTLIDDSYNANPGSVARRDRHARARSAASAGSCSATWRSSGRGAQRLHAEVGAHARASGIDRLVTVGTLVGRGERGVRRERRAPRRARRCDRGAARAAAGRRDGAGQGLAQLRRWRRSCTRCSAGERGNAACCLSSPHGWKTYCRASACSSTSPSARSSRRSPRSRSRCSRARR